MVSYVLMKCIKLTFINKEKFQNIPKSYFHLRLAVALAELVGTNLLSLVGCARDNLDVSKCDKIKKLVT